MEFKSNSIQIFLQLESLEHTTLYLHIRGISYTFQNVSTFSNKFICILTKLNSNVGLNLHFKMQYTPFKWNCSTHQNMYFKIQHSIMCLSIALILIVYHALFVEYRWNQNRRQPPSLKIQRSNLVSKASKPPLIMSIKSHFPLMSRLCIV